MNTKLPKLLKDFLIYLTTIKGKSKRTRKEYQYDLVLFLRFLKAINDDLDTDNINEISIDDITIEDLKQTTLEDIYTFLEYCEEIRKNSAYTRARKVASLKSFFNYLKRKRRLLSENPTEELESPKISKKLPKYMDIDETKQFLMGIKEGPHFYRNTCLMTFFLHLGLRVSELCSLNMNSIQGNALRVVGRGDKERTIFLNQACQNSLNAYLEKERSLQTNIMDKEALFLSQKRTRLSRRTIERIVKSINIRSGLNKDKLSPHKLRHTSATLMYRNGADIRSLQYILGHSSVSTTQIYTHVENKEIRKVLENNPLNF